MHLNSTKNLKKLLDLTLMIYINSTFGLSTDNKCIFNSTKLIFGVLHIIVQHFESA